MTTAARLFNKTVRITAYQGMTNGQFFTTTPNAIIIRDLRVQFEIDLTSEAKPNTCHVTISNCNKTTRQFLEKTPLIVRVDAGFDGVLHNFFVGDLKYGNSKIKKTDWETKLQLGDGDRATRFGNVERSFAPGTSLGEVLKEVAGSMSLVLPGTQGGFAATSLGKVLGQQFTSGYSASGFSAVELTRILTPFNLNWSIQNGKLQILADEETTNADPVVVSEKIGMIESPSFGAPDHTKKPPHLTVKTVIDARMVPGRIIKVESRDINKQFKILKTKHHFDSHGHKNESSIEALPV